MREKEREYSPSSVHAAFREQGIGGSDKIFEACDSADVVTVRDAKELCMAG